MNSLADFKGGKLMLVIGAIILGTIITGFFAFQSTKKGGTFQNAILTGITKTVSTGNNVSSAPIVLSQISGTRFLNKNIDDSKLIYNFQNTYEDVVTNKLIDAKTSSEFLNEPDKLKVMLLSSAPTNIEGTDGYIILNRDGGAKLGNMNFTKFQFKKQNERLKGLSVSAIAVGPFTEDEAKLMQKETFPVSELVPLDNSGKFILVVENQTNDVYQKAADVNIVGSNNSGNPKVQKDITAVIPATTIVNGQKHNILERVGEVLYQKNGSTTTKSLFDDGTSYTNYILRLTVIGQDQIQATIESTESKICKNPNTHRLHNGHCVMLRPEDTPEHKDNLINQLTDEKNKLKDKVDKLKEKADKFDEADNDGTLMLGCLRNFRFEKQGYDGGTSVSFSMCDGQLNIKQVSFQVDGRRGIFQGGISFNLHKSNSLYHYINDLSECDFKFDSIVCTFHGNNPKNILKIFLLKGNIVFNMPQTSRISNRSNECQNPNQNNRGTDLLPGPRSDTWMSENVMGFGKFPSNDLFSSARNGSLEMSKLLFGIEDYLNSLDKNTLLGNKSLLTKRNYTYIGLMFSKPTNIKNKFLSNGHIESIGYYGVDKDLNKIMKPDYTIVPNGRGTPCGENANHAGFFGQYYGDRSKWGSRSKDIRGYTYKIEYVENILLAKRNQRDGIRNSEYY